MKILFLFAAFFLSQVDSEQIWLYYRPIPEISVTLNKEKPLEIPKNYTEVQLNDFNGTIYLNSFSKLDQITGLKIVAQDLIEIEPGAICSNGKLKKIEILLGHNDDFKITQNLFKNCENLEQLSIVGNFDNPNSIDKNTFEKLTKLNFLTIVNVKIRNLTNDYFQNLNLLTNLAINNCNIEKVSFDALDNLKNLKRLDLSHNKFKTLPNNLFKNNAKLQKLLLVDDQLSNLSWDEFEGLTGLTELHMIQNNLTFFNAEKIAKNMPSLKKMTYIFAPLDCKTRDKFANEIKAKYNHPVHIVHKYDPGYHDSCEDED